MEQIRDGKKPIDKFHRAEPKSTLGGAEIIPSIIDGFCRKKVPEHPSKGGPSETEANREKEQQKQAPAEQTTSLPISVTGLSINVLPATREPYCWELRAGKTGRFGVTGSKVTIRGVKEKENTSALPGDRKRGNIAQQSLSAFGANV
ncbi:hypothetical protein ZHAS_00020482 [Anopheles sinensis]|uniref:Uncharacterized protein n=1 Tax=Anopheles sinensis TaxID=74873 RepID=A0A084WPL1_ANOSI|nr:hypothetical protein ZHAS_00020482 [Anopheles sinensis]